MQNFFRSVVPLDFRCLSGFISWCFMQVQPERRVDSTQQKPLVLFTTCVTNVEIINVRVIISNICKINVHANPKMFSWS